MESTQTMTAPGSPPAIASAAPDKGADGRPLLERPAILGLALLLMTFVAYIPAMRGDFIWDDDAYVLNNENLRSLDGLRKCWLEPRSTSQYYPLVFTTFWVEYHLWKLAPLGYHVVNVLLHGLNAILLWRVLRRLGVPGAWLAGAVFAVHPVHVESVAWITERKNTLSGFLYLSAMLAYFRFSPPTAALDTAPRRWGWYAAALALFVGALFSKTVTCSLPAAIVLILWWKRGRLTWRDLAPLVPFFVVGAGLAFVTAWIEKHGVGARGEEWNLTPIDRCLIAGRALWFYASKLLWPAKLTFIYPRWKIDAAMPRQYVFPLAAVGLVLALWFSRRRIGRGPLAAVLLFAGTLVPALGFFDVYPMRYSFVADHFQYLASAALIALVVAVGARWLLRYGRQPQLAGVVGASAALLILGVLTWRQGFVYADARSVWEDTLAKDPNCWMAHYNMGRLLHQQGDHAAAIEHYRKAVAGRWDAHGIYNLGMALAAVGQDDDAITQLRRAVKLEPELEGAWRDLGAVLLRQGHADDAAEALVQAVKLAPEDPAAQHNFAWALFEQGHVADAIAHWQQAVALVPESADYRACLNNALAWRLATHPDSHVRDGGGALKLARQACQAAGETEPVFQDTLAAALAEVGRFHEAAATARKAAADASASGRTALDKQIEQRLKDYEAHRAFRDQRQQSDP